MHCFCFGQILSDICLLCISSSIVLQGSFFCSAAFVFVEDHSNAGLSTQVDYGNEDQHVDSLNAAKHPKAV